MKMVKQVTDTFNRLYDLAPDQKVTRAAMLAELLPAHAAGRKAAPAPVPAKLTELRTFRQVLDEWKQENRNLAKD